MESDTPVRVWVLGATRVETVDGAVDPAWLSQLPGRLLRYLVSQRGRAVPADEILETLWPGAGAGAEGNVRYLVHQLRRRLEPRRRARGLSSSVRCLAGSYALGETVWIDADVFEDLVVEGLQMARAGEHEVALDILTRALDQCRGDFLEDEPYEDWAIPERERLRALAEDVVGTVAEIHERRGDLADALGYARRLADLEPFDTNAQARVIELCLRCGRRGEAARRYGAFRSRLVRAFGEEPEFDLVTAAGVWSPAGKARPRLGSARPPRTG
jgi:DNA-binding SARP family transcriptional activator